jgi:hypothetical protein
MQSYIIKIKFKHSKQKHRFKFIKFVVQKFYPIRYLSQQFGRDKRRIKKSIVIKRS